MRARYGILGALAAVGTALAVAGGCGGSSSDNNTTPDAAADVAQDHAVVPDSAPDVNDAAVCTVDADLNTIDVPDAALGDSGATTGGCLTCGKAACGPDLQTCNADCDCKAALLEIFACQQQGGAFLTCAQTALAGLDSTTQQELQGLGLCIYAACGTQCGFPPPSDAGKDAPSDSPSDSPSDAPTEGG